MMSKPAVLPIQLTPSQVRPVAYRILSKKHGLNLKSSGLDVLTEFLGHTFGVDWRGSKAEKFLDEISRRWKDEDRGLFIEGAPLKEIIRDIVNSIKAAEDVSKDSSPALADRTQTLADTGVRDKPSSQYWKDYFQVVNAQSQPFYSYDPIKKNFDAPKAKPTLLAPAKDQASVFTLRYNLIYNRILRNEAFQTPSFGASMNNTVSMAGSKFYSITFIHNMLGRNNSQFLLFGFIFKGPDGELWIQDLSGKVQLDISQTVPADGLYYTPGQFVLCDGVYFNEKFLVGSLGPPPAERREATKVAYGNIDFLGVHTALQNGGIVRRVERIDNTLEKQLLLQERQHLNHKIVILGMDIFLDQLKYIDALRKLFNQLQQEVDALERAQLPISIIFPGSFKSSPFQANGNSTNYKESFDFLAQLLREHPKIAVECKLVFVPGDNDAWASTFSSGATPLFPLQPLPSLFTNRIKRISPDASFASNPCRMTYLSQEIVIMRDELGSRFRRNSILFPNQTHENGATNGSSQNGAMDIDIKQDPDMDLFQHEEDSDSEEALSQQRALDRLINDSSKVIKPTTKAYIPPDTAEARQVVKTILDQGHLSPFPLSLRPVSWNYDHSLSLTPLPSVMILADSSTPPFRATYEGCHVVNPGPFIQGNKICWIEYTPSTGMSEQKFLYI
ncbi:Dpb2p [Sugiyamaella lignohabitans]|uniref:DNA polymerase epsilon subunit B n=1 Tax=Sugiyamaella lignohabitans TaxID=796027 RepID=A0A161HIM0_9ASCO|nr:Dpb2p [Sugiyamaella lignohabitans]ANB12387.1 Dpb2p [Sugiyamaella lignohabitans]